MLPERIAFSKFDDSKDHLPTSNDPGKEAGHQKQQEQVSDQDTRQPAGNYWQEERGEIADARHRQHDGVTVD